MSTNHDYIPARDMEFYNWEARLYKYAKTDRPGLLPTSRQAEWDTLHARWITAWAKVADGDAKPSEIQAKNDARKNLVAYLRGTIMKVYFLYNIGLTNEIRVELGLPVYKTHKSLRTIGDSTPVLEGKAEGRVHYLYFFREDDRNHYGIIGAADGVEIFMKKGGEFSTDIDDYKFLIAIRKSPYEITFEPKDRSEVVYYVCRWFNVKGEKGPWSNFVTLVVGI